jgi:hypothetical protein
LPIKFTIKFYGPRVAIVALLGRDDGLDAQFHDVGVDPIRAIAFVASQRHRPGHRLSLGIDDARVGALQHRIQHCRFMSLSTGEMEVEGMPFAIAQEVDFCGKPAPRAA